MGSSSGRAIADRRQAQPMGRRRARVQRCGCVWNLRSHDDVSIGLDLRRSWLGAPFASSGPAWHGGVCWQSDACDASVEELGVWHLEADLGCDGDGRVRSHRDHGVRRLAAVVGHRQNGEGRRVLDGPGIGARVRVAA